MGDAIHIPNFPRANDRISPTMMRELMQAVRRNMPIAGSGVRIQRTMGGTIISAQKGTSAIGGGVQEFLHPYKGQWFDSPSSTDASSSTLLGPTSAGYAFYLPNSGSLRIDGVEIPFSGYEEGFRIVDDDQDPYSWKRFASIGSGLVCCILQAEELGSAIYAKLVMESSIPSAAPSDSWFPVCYIYESSVTSGGITETIREIFQYEVGQAVIVNDDRGPFSLRLMGSGDSISQGLVNNYYQVEQVMLWMSDCPAVASWAGNFLWLEGTGSGSEDFNLSYGDMSAYNNKANNPAYDVIPLYKFVESHWPLQVEVDFRNMPQAQVWMEYTL